MKKNRLITNNRKRAPKGNRYLRTKTRREKRERVNLMPAFLKSGKLVGVTLLVVVTLGTLSTGLVFGYHYLVNSQYFMVRKVVLTGINRVSRDQVLEQTGLDGPTNLLAVRLDEMAMKVRSLPWVSDVTITRQMPDTISIDVKERRPKTLINLGALYYVDETGKPFKRLDPKENPGLPIITGFSWEDFVKREEYTRKDVREVFSLLAVLAERNDRFRLDNISEVHFDAARGLTLFTRAENIQVKVGRGDYRVKMRRLGRVLAHLKIKGESEGLVYFNLESAPRVIVRRQAAG